MILNKNHLMVSFLLVGINSSYASFDKNAIVIGASSGIGKAVAKELSKEYNVGIAARRVDKLETLKEEIISVAQAEERDIPNVFIKYLDVKKKKESLESLNELIQDLGGLDLIVISVTAWTKEEDLLAVDIVGFYNIVSFAAKFFEEQKRGHLVGISSVDALRGNSLYSAVKAFEKNYLEVIRNHMEQNKIPVYVTTILPGWVDTERAKPSEMPGTYWVTDAQNAAEQICNAIKSKKKEALIPQKWKLMSWLWSVVPDCVYNAEWFMLR